jgi:ferric-dicitrate binding protein FerR (iron transport regulator)
MPLKIPWDLFEEVADENCSGEKLRQLDVWRMESKLHQLIYDSVVEDKEFQYFLLEKPIHPAQAWDKLKTRLAPDLSGKKNKTAINYWISAAAAVILLMVGLFAGIWFEGRRAVPVPAGYSYVYSPLGQRTRIILPDGSQVWLNSGTSIRYNTDFNLHHREVNMEGEAFFKVMPDKNKMFVVNTSDLKIRVHGTSFNIKAYPGEKMIETTLIEGNLSVQSGNFPEGHEIYLKPNERLTYIRENSKMEVASGNAPEKRKSPLKVQPKLTLLRNIDTETEQSWKDGKLLFKDESFADLAVKLERWYDVKIHFMDEKIKSYRFTGKFDKETINEAMEALRISSQESYRYDIEFRDIYLRPN